MATPVIQIVLGLLPLLFGRRLFWIFVGVAGFVFGLSIGEALFPAQSETVRLLIGVGVGLIGAVLALFFTKPLAALGGFLALGGLGLGLGAAFGVSADLSWLVFLIAGVLGAILVLAVFDWGLIIVSAFSGASAVTAGVILLWPGSQGLNAAILTLILTIIGIAFQASDLAAGKPVVGLQRKRRYR